MLFAVALPEASIDQNEFALSFLARERAVLWLFDYPLWFSGKPLQGALVIVNRGFIVRAV